MFLPADVIHIYQLLLANGIQIWLCGGWGIDALLCEQTRPHKDLDVLMRVDDIVPMIEILGREGYNSIEYWEENKWVTEESGRRVATAVFIIDFAGRQFDAHAIRFDEDGKGVAAWEDPQNFIFTRKDLFYEGIIEGVAVLCISPEMQVRFHMGYELPEKQRGDLDQLYKRFGVAYSHQ